MDRCGLASSTRQVALRRWGRLPKGDLAKRVEELYRAENKNKSAPSGSQDMIGLLYPGISRLDYDFRVNGGIFPCHIESCNDLRIVRWLESVIRVLPVAPRPDDYDPLGVKNLDPKWIRKLGESGRDCYEAILHRDVEKLGHSLNVCMACWAAVLPNTVRHPALRTDLLGILKYYQSKYPGAMFSGCGGGYLFIASEEAVPGTFTIQVRVAK